MRKWTKEEEARLIDLYENGGDKACLPMRVIAMRLNRSLASCWAKLIRLYKQNRKANHDIQRTTIAVRVLPHAYP